MGGQCWGARHSRYRNVLTQHRKEQKMNPTKMLRFASALHISVATLLVCVSPSNGQPIGSRLDSRTALAATVAQIPTAAGNLITFDPPGSTGTSPSGINSAGEISGTYSDNSFNSHGFVRAPDGTITTFDVPGAIFTVASGINE